MSAIIKGIAIIACMGLVYLFKPAVTQRILAVFVLAAGLIIVITGQD